jgi:hypothetical protein
MRTLLTRSLSLLALAMPTLAQAQLQPVPKSGQCQRLCSHGQDTLHHAGANAEFAADL